MTTVVEFFFSSLYNKRMYKKYRFILNEQFVLLFNIHLENALYLHRHHYLYLFLNCDQEELK